jgi:nanoRNase/pAp phosphatase (c-di-AMP/oligoRNAs hydrolase)
MNEHKEVAELIAKLEGILASIEAISQRNDQSRKLELVQLRRLLAETIGQISESAKRLFSVFPDHKMEETFRTKLNQMRNAVAMHQTNFSAAALDERILEYRESALNVGRANREFIDWVKVTLAQLNAERKSN